MHSTRNGARLVVGVCLSLLDSEASAFLIERTSDPSLFSGIQHSLTYFSMLFHVPRSPWNLRELCDCCTRFEKGLRNCFLRLLNP
ncbi:hypothetical protein C8Q77DRAFT_326056 [Trametes polyzona]|nr:hypothetical protein C8Q77DRAFT_326056 [Trametes polyzona]